MDDSGRLLDVCDIGDDPYGYAYLSTLLAERASGPYSVAIAADSDRRLVPALLTTAGWALALVDTDFADDVAERFADDLSGEVGAAPTQRRALGLARALHAGALSAASLPAPAELAGLKPVLAAHGALATGRHAAAVALREVLRELYPAALRAYPDPADPVALAVMNALPEPGALASSTSGRGRDAAAAADAVTAELAAAGMGDPASVTEAITALRVAIAETPRRGALSKGLTTTVAEAVRQSVAAVRACDDASTVLVRALAERVASPERAAPAPAPALPDPVPSSPAPASPVAARASVPRHQAPTPHPGSPAPPAPPEPAAAPPPMPVAAPQPPPQPGPPPPQPPQPGPPQPPVAQPGPPPLGPPPLGPPPPQPPVAQPPPAPDPVAPPPTAPAPMGPAPVAPPPMAPPPAAPRAAAQPDPAPAAGHGTVPVSPGGRPVSVPPPPPPGITPITESRSSIPSPRRARYRDDPPEDGQVQVPTPRPAPPAGPGPERTGPRPGPAPGSRSEWPTRPPADDTRSPVDLPTRPTRSGGTRRAEPDPVPPPWQADDLRPPEQPPVLKLVEPTLPEELRDGLGYPEPRPQPEPPPLRLVEPPGNGVPESVPPVSADDDDTLLIFAQTRSAWFSGEGDTDWNSALDVGWRAAEQAAQAPTTGERTGAGLPRRVPSANLVPGSAPADDRALRVVRDPASIAAHTSGYFNGWRRGQEAGGYPLGGRQQAGGAWDFARDDERLSG